MMVTIMMNYIDDLKKQGSRVWEMEVQITWVAFKAIRVVKIKIEHDHNNNYDDNGDYYDWYWWWRQRWHHILLHKEDIIFQLARSEPIKTIPWPVLAVTTAQNRPQLPSRGVRVSNNAYVTKGMNIDAGLMVSVDVSRFGVGPGIVRIKYRCWCLGDARGQMISNQQQCEINNLCLPLF